MQLRHKTPTIFNIYMLDIICCALGCVILLWQVAHQEAVTQTDKAKKEASAAHLARLAHEKALRELQTALDDVLGLQEKQRYLLQALASAEKELNQTRKVAADRQDELNKSNRALDLSKEEYAKLQADLAKWVAAHEKISKELAGKEKISTELLAKLVLANTQIASLEKDVKAGLLDLNKVGKKSQLQKEELDKLQADLAKWIAAHDKLTKDLVGKEKISAELLGKLLLANQQITSLEKDAKLKLIDLTAAEKKAQQQASLLRVSQEDAGRLQKLLDSLQAENKAAQTKIKLTELTLKVREDDLDRTRKDLTLLLTTKDLLNKRVASLEADIEQRFAGIPLTGENVVFLIDVSGSMVMKDVDTDDPDKWPFLCDTIMKLMKSIPTLQRFQVILFSEKTERTDGKKKEDPVVHLFQNRDQWLKYEGPKTAVRVRDALREVKPDGGTNMHAGFDEAFRYRNIKLDTIYLFSDGLPNVGPGVPANISKPSETQKNAYMAKFVRDKLKSDWNRPDKKMPDVRINAVGFYFESPDVGAFLWALAREHKGNFVGLR